MLRRILLILSSSILIFGCASPKGGDADHDAAASYPVWITNPEKPGYLSVVGAAPKQEWGGYQAQYRVAMLKARQELAQIVRVHIDSTSRFSVVDNAGEIRRDSDIQTTLRSDTELSLEAAVVIEEWVDPNTGELFIWLATPR